MQDPQSPPSPPKTPPAPNTEEVFGLLGQLEQRLGQLRDWQAHCDGQYDHLREHAQELDTKRAQLDQQAQTVQHREKELTGLRDQIERERAEFQEKWRQLDDRQQSIEQRQNDLDEQRQAFDRQRQEFEQQFGPLEQVKTEFTQKQEELNRAKQQFEEELAAFEQVKEHFEQEQAEAGRFRETHKAAKQELEAERAQLDQARHELAEQSKQIHDVGAEAASQFEQIKRELEQTKAALDEREAELAKRESEWSAAGDSGIDPDAFQQREAELERREAELEQKRAAYREALAQSKQQLAAEKEHLRKQAMQLSKDGSKAGGETEAAIHRELRRRQTKLKQYKQLLREKSRQLKHAQQRQGAHTPSHAGLEKERQMLIEVKKFLEASEAEMIKRWATSKAFGLLIGMVLMLTAMAAFSYALADKLIKPTWRASMAYEIQLPEPDPEAPPITSQAWLAEHKGALMSRPVIRETLTQLQSQGIHKFAEENALQNHLIENVALTGNPPTLRLTYQSDDADRVVSILETLSRAYLGYRTQQDRIAGVPATTTIVQQPQRDSAPLEDLRLQNAGIYFGAMCGGALILWLIFRVMLVRAKSLFDPDESPQLTVLDKPSTWSPLQRVGKG